MAFGLPDGAANTIYKTWQPLTFYMTISVGLVYFNRIMLKGAWPFAVFVTWSQQFTGLMWYYFFAYLGTRFNIALLQLFTPTLPSLKEFPRFLPQIICFGTSVILSNACLQQVQVSTYQVARSLSMPFVVILSIIILKQWPSRVETIAVVLITFGVLIGSLDPSTLAAYGLALGISASFLESLNKILISKLVQGADTGTILKYALWGSFFYMMIPCVMFNQWMVAWNHLFYEDTAFRFTALMAGGLFCVLINIALFWLVKVTSANTVVVCGFTKSVVQSAGAIAFLGDKVTILSFSSLMTSLSGSALYSFTRFKINSVAESEHSSEHLPDIEESYHVEVEAEDVELGQVSDEAP